MSCGPGWLGTTKLFDNPFGFKLTRCCDMHDGMYAKPKGKTREECDVAFWHAMLARIRKYAPRKHELFRFIARRYFRWVRLFGWIAWRRCRKKDRP